MPGAMPSYRLLQVCIFVAHMQMGVKTTLACCLEFRVCQTLSMQMGVRTTMACDYSEQQLDRCSTLCLYQHLSLMAYVFKPPGEHVSARHVHT